MPKSDPRVLAVGTAPTPFTAEEIREGCPTGRTVRLLVERDGHAAVHRVSRFVETDLEGAILERSSVTTNGEPLTEPETHRATWRDLQAHASFPSEHTTVEEDVIETPIGRLECLRYRVADGSTVETFWFARAYPGMPVKVTTEEGGRVSATVTMIASEVE